MNLNINHTQPNFEARIKLKSPNTKALLQGSVGAAVLSTGAAALADGAISLNATATPGPNYTNSINNTPPASISDDILKSHEDILTSAKEYHDGVGYVKEIPVQSTILPAAMTVGGCLGVSGGLNGLNNASNGGLDRSSVNSVNCSKYTSTNKNFHKTVMGTGLLATAAGSLYSGYDGGKPYTEEQYLSRLGGYSTIGTPAIIGSDKLSNLDSSKNSSNFLSETLLEGPNKNKKLPS